MQHSEGFFEGPRGLKLYHQHWLPDGDVKAVLMIVHGLGEHSGRYMNVVNYFVPQGYAVYALDHIGHGKSEGGREEVERFNDYTLPLKSYFERIQKEQPGKPIFLVGHSMGGLIGAVYLLDYQAGLAGAVLSAPAVKIPDNISPVTLIMGRVLSIIAPKAGVIALDANGISRDPAVVSAYVADPLVFHGKTPARLSAEMLAGMKRVETETAKITLPLMLVQGEQDKLVDPGGARLLYEKAASADKTIKTYPGLYHEVFNEPERLQVLGDVQTWIEKHI
jgi:acylglycerol lipase